MNRQLRLAAAATMMAAVQFATAQVKMAPNYFRADPAVYKYRMAKVVEWEGTESEQNGTSKPTKPTHSCRLATSTTAMSTDM